MNTPRNAQMDTWMNRKKIQWLYPAAILLVSIAAFLVRWRGIGHITADIETCLIPWSNELQPGLGIRALKRFDGDYNMPYVTILWLLNYFPGSTLIKVKLVSILFDYLGACGAGLIAAWFAKQEKKKIYFFITYILVLFYPVTIMNSAYWGQCDFIYVTFLLYMFLCLLQGRFRAAMILLGCAFSFKLQAVLLLPFLMIYYWKSRKFSFTNFLLVPLVMEILCIPAMAGGYSALIPFSVYLRQLGRYPYMYVYYPNFWALFRDAPYYIFKTVSMAGIFLALLVFTVAVCRRKKAPGYREWLFYAVWTVFLMMCFLPCMHERYGFLLEILLIIYAVTEPGMWWAALTVCAGTTISYLQVTFAKHYFSDQWIAAAYLLVFGFLTIRLIKTWNSTDAQNQMPEKSQEYSDLEKKTFREWGMFVWEKRVIAMLNRYMIPVAAVISAAGAVVIRKAVIECRSADYLSNLIETADTRHTCFYMFGMKLLSDFDGKPLFFLLKIGCMVSDLLAAALFAVIVGAGYQKEKNVSGQEEQTDVLLRMFLAFAVYLILPSTLLNSGIWGHADSFCIFLVMAGWLFWKKRKIMPAAFCWGIGSAVLAYYLPYVILLLAGDVILTERKNKASGRQIGLVLISMAVVMTIFNFTGLLAGYTPLQCLVRMSFLRVSGSYVIYPAAVFLLVMCFREIKWAVPFLLLQITVILDWGQYLYEEPLAPAVLIRPGYFLTAVLCILLAVRMCRDNRTRQNAISGE